MVRIVIWVVAVIIRSKFYNINTLMFLLKMFKKNNKSQDKYNDKDKSKVIKEPVRIQEFGFQDQIKNELVLDE